MKQGKPTVEDRGTAIFIQIRDEITKKLLDPRDAESVTATVRRPNGTAVEIPLTPSTHPDFPAAVDPEVEPDPARNPAWQLAGAWSVFVAPAGWFAGGGSGPWQFLPRYTLSPTESWRQAEATILDIYR